MWRPETDALGAAACLWFVASTGEIGSSPGSVITLRYPEHHHERPGVLSLAQRPSHQILKDCLASREAETASLPGIDEPASRPVLVID